MSHVSLVLRALCASHRLWNHWLPDATSETQQKRFWRQWISGHLEAASKHLKKPVVLEEFGLRYSSLHISPRGPASLPYTVSRAY